MQLRAGEEIVRVRVSAGARKELLTALGEYSLAVSVREPAEEHRANDRVRTMLALHYGVSESRVRLVGGHLSPSKTFAIKIA